MELLQQHYHERRRALDMLPHMHSMWEELGGHTASLFLHRRRCPGADTSSHPRPPLLP